MIHWITKQRGLLILVFLLDIKNVLLNALPHFLRNNPHIYIQVIEVEGKKLKNEYDGDLNLAFLIEPTNLDAQKFNKYIIYLDEYVAYMDKHHPLVQKEALDWSDLCWLWFTIFSQNIYDLWLVVEKLQVHNA